MDCFVTDPENNVLYNEKKKQYDSFSHTTAMKGIYKVCFSNEFSTFTHKTVYLEFRHGDEEPLLPGMTRTTALTQVRLSLFLRNKALKSLRILFCLKKRHLLGRQTEKTPKATIHICSCNIRRVKEETV